LLTGCSKLVVASSWAELLNLMLLFVAVLVLTRYLRQVLQHGQVDGEKKKTSATAMELSKINVAEESDSPGHQDQESRMELEARVALALQRPSRNYSSKKYYAVLRGVQPGIYYTWEDCKRQIDRYKGCRYKSFPTREEAEEFLGVRR
jgi:hypothetical protein